MRDAFILGVVLLGGVAFLHPSVGRRAYWRATVTPLASIIGSGFLVLGPVLLKSFGRAAPLAMAALCAGAYAFGAAVRFNMRRIDAVGPGRSRLEAKWETVASWALAFSYIVSVAYYLNLFGSFGVSLTPWHDRRHAQWLTSAMLLLILVVGWTRGFHALERMEQVAVSAKLAIIGGLLVGLALYLSERAALHLLVFDPPQLTGWAAVAMLFGLIVTVQGFETSRYLGAAYDTAMRVGSMRLAQWLSTAIYVVYIGLLAVVFDGRDLPLSETAIVDMMRVVAPILPALLVAAALGAQFSAALADTGGAGGLFGELTRQRLSARQAYALLVAVGLVLTWTANVFEIISYASRAFALYYALQAAIAARGAQCSGEHWLRVALYAALALLGGLMVAFGAPVAA